MGIGSVHRSTLIIFLTHTKPGLHMQLRVPLNTLERPPTLRDILMRQRNYPAYKYYSARPPFIALPWWISSKTTIKCPSTGILCLPDRRWVLVIILNTPPKGSWNMETPHIEIEAMLDTDWHAASRHHIFAQCQCTNNDYARQDITHHTLTSAPLHEDPYGSQVTSPTLFPPLSLQVS